MLSRFARQLAKPAALGSQGAAGLPVHIGTQARFASRAAVHGSKGRKMPDYTTRATAPVSGLDATFTIRVLILSHLRLSRAVVLVRSSC
jgi:carbamoyl-phosphate synthase small subunit